MKKNFFLKLASGLLVLCLASTCAIGTTFAKYTTSGQATDSARVAKFGVAITANGETFAKEYDTHDTSVVGTITKSVLSTDKVVAPGTSGDMVSMTLSGTPEVAVKVSYVADFALSDNWTVDGVFYCPLVINVEGTYVKGTEYTDKADFEAAVENLINGWTKNYAAGTDLSKVSDDSVSVSWEWPFETTDKDGVVCDYNDTFLGNQAAAGNPATVALTITTTVTQVD